MTYENRMERAQTVWLTPRPGCPVPLADGRILRTGDRIASTDPIARQYRHRLMALSAAPDPVSPTYGFQRISNLTADDDEDGNG